MSKTSVYLFTIFVCLLSHDSVVSLSLFRSTRISSPASSNGKYSESLFHRPSQRDSQNFFHRLCALAQPSKYDKELEPESFSGGGCSSSSHKSINVQRRTVFTYIATSLGPLLIPTLPASAAQGAAEYDLEFYLRDLFQGNNREGNVQASLPPIPLPPRTLQLASFVLINDSCDGNCMSVALLSNLTGIPSNDISTRVIQLRQKVYKPFQTKNPWNVESVDDEYYFDLTAYCLFRVSAEIIPNNYSLRDSWVRQMGRYLYTQAKQNPLLVPPATTTTSNTTTTPTIIPLSQSTQTLIQLLDLFNSTRYISSYRIQKDPILDSLDDEDIQQGRSINLLISLYRPATLGSAMQLTAEGSRFSPEFIAPTLAAMWEDLCHLYTEYETYFVDNTYRPNPKDFFPDEVLLQLTIKSR